ncbi:MAG: nucleoside triphosphate pyrophosphohydrolase [Pseudomonadota bacterium]
MTSLLQNQPFQLQDLLDVMSRLRDPDNGCPWDLEQTPQTLVKYTLEECYELIDAVESNDIDHVVEELGDVLLQIVFYCQLAQEQGQYNFSDVVQGITQKMIRRHPHIFSSQPETLSKDEVLSNWDRIKQAEKQDAASKGLFDNVPVSFPSMLRAHKLQRCASKVGFDVGDTMDALSALKSEIAELEAAITNSDEAHIMDEMGDVLFSCVNVSRHLSVSADEALRLSSRKFVSRMSDIEALLREKGLEWDELSEKDRDTYWSLVK